MAHDVNHDYHLVNPSPWPAVGSLFAFVLAIGAIIWMKSDEGGLFGATGPAVFIIGLGGVLFTMFGWWRDVIAEAESGKDHTPVVQIGLRYGMVLFIASEVMFFVAWFWAYFNAAMFPGAADASNAGDLVGQVARSELFGGHWPPAGIEVFDPWHLPLLNTVILVTSSFTVTWAHHALQQGDRDNTKLALWITVLLGMVFTGVQAYEYAHAAFGFSGNVYGATFFMATGFHGFHVIVGTIFLFICLFRVYAGHFKPDHHFGFEAAAWYWHFVDTVWIFLFAAIYVWGSTGAVIAGH